MDSRSCSPEPWRSGRTARESRTRSSRITKSGSAPWSVRSESRPRTLGAAVRPLGVLPLGLPAHHVARDDTDAGGGRRRGRVRRRLHHGPHGHAGDLEGRGGESGAVLRQGSALLSVFPSPARWLPDGTPQLQKLIVARALLDVGLTEEPPGSNRSPAIDGYMTRVGSPVGLSWCAAGVAAWWSDACAQVPPTEAGAVRAWWAWGLRTGAVVQVPEPGDAVIYAFGDGRTPDHMGVVVRADPRRLTVEANTTFKRQAGDEREGIGCTLAVEAGGVVGYLRARSTQP